MGFAFAAAIDSDKRLFPLMVVYDGAAIKRERSWTVSRGGDDEERNHTSDASMSGRDSGQVVHGGGESESWILEHQSILFLGCK